MLFACQPHNLATKKEKVFVTSGFRLSRNYAILINHNRALNTLVNFLVVMTLILFYVECVMLPCIFMFCWFALPFAVRVGMPKNIANTNTRCI